MGRTPNGYESKKYGFYFPVDLIDRIRARLPDEGIKLNALMRSLLVEWLSDREDSDKAKAERQKVIDRGGW